MDKFRMEPFKGGVPQEGNPFTLDEKLMLELWSLEKFTPRKVDFLLPMVVKNMPTKVIMKS